MFQKFVLKKYNSMKTFSHNAVIVFSKYPEDGEVKTRLAKTLNNKFAVKFCKICAEHLFNEVLKISGEKILPYLFYSEESDKEKIKSWTKSKFLLNSQEGKDIGEKMFNAFKKVFHNGAQKVMIVGTDIPDITSEILYDGLSALNESDIVMGPSADGGYYLLGMKNLYQEFFTNVEWSGSKVFEKTLEKIKTQNLSFHLLPELTDIDTEEDLRNWLDKEQKEKVNPVRAAIETIYLSFTEGSDEPPDWLLGTLEGFNKRELSKSR